MIYVEINDIVHEFRKALALDPNIQDEEHVLEQIQQLSLANNCKVIGSYDAGGWWCTDGIEFPDEASLNWFKLKWSR
jgi:hypothetical protein